MLDRDKLSHLRIDLLGGGGRWGIYLLLLDDLDDLDALADAHFDLQYQDALEC